MTVGEAASELIAAMHQARRDDPSADRDELIRRVFTREGAGRLKRGADYADQMFWFSVAIAAIEQLTQEAR